MAQNLSLTNYSASNIVERAKLAADAAKSQAVIVVDNAQNIVANDYLLIGRPGGNISAVYQVLSVNGTSITLTTNLSAYAQRGDEVTKLYGNQLKVYRAAYSSGSIPTDGEYTVVGGSPVDIDPDQLTTNFTDSTGGSGYWYKYTFYNSTTTNETAIAASKAVRDTSSTDYASIDDVRREAGFAGNTNVTDELIYRKLQAAQSKINGMLSGRYVLPLGQPVNPIIADLTVRLAAGYVMIAEYGTFDGQDKTKGEKLRDDAMAELTAYQDGSQVITDMEAVSQVVEDAGGFESSYGENTAESPVGFTRADIDCYTSRVY